MLPGVSGASGRPRAAGLAGCGSWGRFGARESIFKISHTNYFFGIEKYARKVPSASGALHGGRWVYERVRGKEQKDGSGSVSARSPTAEQRT